MPQRKKQRKQKKEIVVKLLQTSENKTTFLLRGQHMFCGIVAASAACCMTTHWQLHGRPAQVEGWAALWGGVGGCSLHINICVRAITLKIRNGKCANSCWSTSRVESSWVVLSLLLFAVLVILAHTHVSCICIFSLINFFLFLSQHAEPHKVVRLKVLHSFAYFFLPFFVSWQATKINKLCMHNQKLSKKNSTCCNKNKNNWKLRLDFWVGSAVTAERVIRVKGGVGGDVTGVYRQQLLTLGRVS